MRTVWKTHDLKGWEHRFFTNEQLVENFLILFDYWWDDSNNLLHGKREEAKQYLDYFMQYNHEPEGYTSCDMVYVLTKFETDYLPHFQKVACD